MAEIKLNLQDDEPESGLVKKIRADIANATTIKQKKSLEQVLRFAQRFSQGQGLGIGQGNE